MSTVLLPEVAMLLIEDGRRKTLAQLDAIAVPEVAPWAGRRGGAARWQPIQHGRLARACTEAAEQRGLAVREARWATNPSETDLFGAIVFRKVETVRAPAHLELALGLRHSNAGRHAVAFGFGAQVLVCTNGMLAAEHVVSRKHTKDLRVEDVVAEGFDAFLEAAPSIVATARQLRERRIDRRTADLLIVEAGRRKVLPWSKLGEVEAEWRRPSHRAFRPRTAWSLYNAFTEVAKRRSPHRQLLTLRGLAPLFEARALRRLAG